MEGKATPDIGQVAKLMGEPARAAMLAALLGGRALPAGELARLAAVAPATASAHLARLTEGGLLTRRRSGRHRYYELADSEVAAALEALARVAGGPVPPSAPEPSTTDPMRFARSCYDHLAGVLAIRLVDALVDRGVISAGSYELTDSGGAWLEAFGIDTSALRRGRRPLTRACLDWSERRDHLAGAAGAALLRVLLDRGWLVRIDGTRAVRLTLRGREGLRRSLGLELDAGGGSAR